MKTKVFKREGAVWHYSRGVTVNNLEIVHSCDVTYFRMDAQDSFTPVCKCVDMCGSLFILFFCQTADVRQEEGKQQLAQQHC